MRRFITALCFVLFPVLAHAWNAAGHRLTASIAWQQISPAHQDLIHTALSHHPDYQRWVSKAKTDQAGDIFAEASTWPDDIRNDPRFYSAGREMETARVAGFPEMDRHKNWHYVDLNKNGKVHSGEIDRQIERLSRVLRWTTENEQISYALPWLIHLLADIHQPLHVGRHGDEGGNQVEIENPFNKRLPFSSLHVYWDDLPGPPWLRGKRLSANAARLTENYPPPTKGNVALWRAESHQLLAKAYPESVGSLLPIINESFHQHARQIANQQIVAAGYRLGWLLESIFSQRVSRETP